MELTNLRLEEDQRILVKKFPGHTYSAMLRYVCLGNFVFQEATQLDKLYIIGLVAGGLYAQTYLTREKWLEYNKSQKITAAAVLFVILAATITAHIMLS